MDTESRNFHLKEFDSLRAEVAVLLSRIENLFKYSCIAAATVFAWLLTNSISLTKIGSPCLSMAPELVKWAWFIPPFFTYAALFLALVNNVRVEKIGKYLRKVEDALGEEALGWEKFSQPGFPALTLSTGLVWLALVAGATYAAKTGIASVQHAKDANSVCEAKK